MGLRLRVQLRPPLRCARGEPTLRAKPWVPSPGCRPGPPRAAVHDGDLHGPRGEGPPSRLGRPQPRRGGRWSCSLLSGRRQLPTPGTGQCDHARRPPGRGSLPVLSPCSSSTRAGALSRPTINFSCRWNRNFPIFSTETRKCHSMSPPALPSSRSSPRCPVGVDAPRASPWPLPAPGRWGVGRRPQQDTKTLTLNKKNRAGLRGRKTGPGEGEPGSLPTLQDLPPPRGARESRHRGVQAGHRLSCRLSATARLRASWPHHSPRAEWGRASSQGLGPARPPAGG